MPSPTADFLCTLAVESLKDIPTDAPFSQAVQAVQRSFGVVLKNYDVARRESEILYQKASKLISPVLERVLSPHQRVLEALKTDPSISPLSLMEKLSQYQGLRLALTDLGTPVYYFSPGHPQFDQRFAKRLQFVHALLKVCKPPCCDQKTPSAPQAA